MSKVDTLSAAQLLNYVDVLERATAVAQLTRGDHQSCLAACQGLADVCRSYVSLREEVARAKAIRKSMDEPVDASEPRQAQRGSPEPKLAGPSEDVDGPANLN